MDINGETGAFLPDDGSVVRQAFRDRLLTVPTTRIMRPEYGSILPTVIDSYAPEGAISAAIAAAGEAESHRFIITGTRIAYAPPNTVRAQVDGRFIQGVGFQEEVEL